MQYLFYYFQYTTDYHQNYKQTVQLSLRSAFPWRQFSESFFIPHNWTLFCVFLACKPCNKLNSNTLNSHRTSRGGWRILVKQQANSETVNWFFIEPWSNKEGETTQKNTWKLPLSRGFVFTFQPSLLATFTPC